MVILDCTYADTCHLHENMMLYCLLLDSFRYTNGHMFSHTCSSPQCTQDYIRHQLYIYPPSIVKDISDYNCSNRNKNSSRYQKSLYVNVLPETSAFCISATNEGSAMLNSLAGSIYLPKYTTFRQRIVTFWYGVNVAGKKIVCFSLNY